MTFDRRDFLKLTGGGAGAAFATTLYPSAVYAAETVTGVTYLPPSYKALSFGSNGFVDFLKKNAADAVAVDFYDSGKLLKADEQLPALRAGTIDFMFHTTSYVTRSIPILGITGLPGVVEELYENPDRLAQGSPLFELINEQLAEEDLHALSLGGNILQPEYIWSTEAAPIRSIADIQGKKVRVVSFEATKVIEGFGGAAVRIPSSETYLALQRGTVDAAVANISTIVGRSLQEQLGTVYKLPLTAFGIGVFVERNRWEKMDGGVKTALQNAAAWFDAESAMEANEKIYPDEYWPMIEEAGIEIVEPSEEDLAKLEQAAEEVIAAWKEEVGEEVGSRAIQLATGAAS